MVISATIRNRSQELNTRYIKLPIKRREAEKKTKTKNVWSLNIPILSTACFLSWVKVMFAAEEEITKTIIPTI